MTIYLTKWVYIEEDVTVPKVYASSSLTEAKKRYNEVRTEHKEMGIHSPLDLLPISEAITKHSPKTQADVIELINSL